ncbi:hypothetical protein MOQ_000064 [Trypanosoma cruzi marinkellei]|uniref:Uncharacterized protein n=1 Tax=Trypanosoma cruzi marinkellei TaxID=85056 RepID=K2NXB5_TRYCR|nr:hypothetical protein MOQ_000064 [Trypanosoma cruzi marinkellei]
MSSCTGRSSWRLEGTLRVLFLAVSSQGAVGTHDINGHVWSVAEDICQALVRLDGTCLQVHTSSSSSSSSLSSTARGGVRRAIILTGDAILHQLLLGRGKEKDSPLLKLSGCRVGAEAERKKDGVPSEEQLVEAISTHLLTSMNNDGSWDSLKLWTSPHWFIYVSGDTALRVSGAGASLPASILQQRPGIVLWFYREAAPVVCDVPSPEATVWFADWWRNLQRSLLLPSVEPAMDLLLFGRRDYCGDATDPCLTPGGLLVVEEENGSWHVDWNHTPFEATTPSHSMTPLLPHEEIGDFDRQPSFFSPTEMEDLSPPKKGQQVPDPPFSEDVLEMLALEPVAKSSTKYSGFEKGEILPRLQMEFIQECFAQIFLCIFADDTSLKPLSSAEPAPCRSSPSSPSSSLVWYLQLVMQYAETGGTLTCALGGSPQLCLTPSVDAASRFFLLSDEASKKDSTGWNLHSVDHPGVFMKAVPSKTGWRFVLFSRQAMSPSPCVRVTVTSANREGSQERIFASDAATSSCGGVVYAETRVVLEDGTPKRQREAVFWRVRVVPSENTEEILYLAANLDYCELAAVQPTEFSNTSFLPVYASLTPLWRSHIMTQMKRHPHSCGIRTRNSCNSPFSLTFPTSLQSCVTLGSPFSPLSEKDFFSSCFSLPEKMKKGVGFLQEMAGQCHLPLFVAAAARFFQEPLHVVFVGSSAVGKTTMVQWLWAWSRGWGDAHMLRALHNWLQRRGDDIVEGSGEGDGGETSVLTALLQSPLPSPLLEEETTTTSQSSQRVELKICGETHVFVGHDAQFLLQSFVGVNEAVLTVTDAGIPVSVKVVDVPGSSPRELLRTHCKAADVVICVVDMQDQFSLSWLEERLDVITAGSTLEKEAEWSGPSVAARVSQQQRQQQQKFVLLKVNDDSPRQVVFSQDVRRFLRRSGDVMRIPNNPWLLWSLPCMDEGAILRCSGMLYRNFVKVLQERHACRLVFAVMGWENVIVTRLQKLSCHMDENDGRSNDNTMSEQPRMHELFEEMVSKELGRTISTLSPSLCDVVAKEVLWSGVATPLTNGLPLWWRVLRWLMMGFSISDPLAHCVWLALQTERENKGVPGVGDEGDDFELLDALSKWWEHPISLRRLRFLLEEFYRLGWNSRQLSMDSFVFIALLARALAKLTFVNISLTSMGTWLGHAVGLGNRISDGEDEMELFFALMFCKMGRERLSAVPPETTNKRANFFHETLIKSLVVFRLLHDASPLLGALQCVLPQEDMEGNRMAALLGNVALQRFHNSFVISTDEEKLFHAVVKQAMVGVSEEAECKLHDRPTPFSKEWEFIEDDAETMSSWHGTSYFENKNGRRVKNELSVVEVVRSFRNVWPEADFEYPLEWYNKWTEEDEANFIDAFYRAIQRYEDDEHELRQRVCGEEALERFAPPRRMYVVTQPGYTKVDMELEALYCGDATAVEEEDLAPLSR